jgi:predicted ferric reductase
MRYTYKKGFLWLFVFFVLTCVPLFIAISGKVPVHRGFWTEFGVALGFIGLGMFAIQFLFSGRFGFIAPTYGMDNIIQFHREAGIIAFLFVLAHPVIIILSDSFFLSYLDPEVDMVRAIALYFLTIIIILLVVTSIWRVSFSLSYEVWRLLHGIFGVFVIIGGLGHALLVSHYLNSLWQQAAMVAFIGMMAYLLVHTRVVRPWLIKRKPYRVVDVKEERNNSYTMILESEYHEKMFFIPGQFAWITLGDTPFQLQQHPFSFASSGLSNKISFTAKELGDFTGTWKDVKPGTKAFLEGPFGSFTPEPDTHLFLIMGGIGITPAMSMLRTMKDNKDPRKAILIYGNKNFEDIIFREELGELSEKINLKVVHVLEEPDDKWKGEEGFVDEALLRKYLSVEKEKYMYFICGPKPLMDTAEISLRNLEVDWRLIYTERFEIV